MKFSGNAFLNCRPMPRPITPTVFTVLTKASTFASKRLPCPASITLTSSTIVPVRANLNERLMRAVAKGIFDSTAHRR